MGSCCSSAQSDPKINTRPGPKSDEETKTLTEDDPLGSPQNSLKMDDSIGGGGGEYTSQCVELQQRLKEFCTFYNNPKKINQKSLLKIWEKLGMFFIIFILHCDLKWFISNLIKKF